MHKIHESLQSLAMNIDALIPFDRNPRRGNIQAIAASYQEFGQVRPIVVRPNDDGTFTVVAGNHQLEAARQLGWDKIAAIQFDVDDERAIAFAIADNRTMELGYTEPEILNELIIEINDYYPELLDGLGWDEFQMAELEQTLVREDRQIIDSGSYVPPILLTQKNENDDGSDISDEDFEKEDDENPLDSSLVSVSTQDDGQNKISLKPLSNQDDVAIRGSTVALRGAAPNATVTVQITFDTTEQQSLWYEFVKFLKSNSDYSGTTVGEKLINFIKENT